MRDEEYFAIKERAARQFLKIPHVNAVGIGSKEKNGKPTGKIAIKVFITKKKPRGEVPSDEVIPPEFEGIPTDIVEMGPIKPLAAIPGAPDPVTSPRTPDNTRAFPLPLKGGIQIGPEEIDMVGTLGCIVVDKNDSTAVYALTNYHVIDDDDGKISLSRRVEQPHFSGGFNADNSNRIGIIAGGSDDSTRDAALIRLTPQTEWLAEVKDIGKFITGTHTVTVAEAGTGNYQVKKRGITTLLTGGFVSAIMTRAGSVSNGMIIMPNPDPDSPDTLTFFGGLGDSGSVCLNDSEEVVGLLFAGDFDPSSERFGAGGAIPIEAVLERFKEVEQIDLKVATATETGQIQTVPHPAGAPRMSGSDIEERGDHDLYRPLTGGIQILAAPMLGHMNTTTLGCLVKVATEPDAVYVLTSYRGVSAGGSIPPTVETDIGQPDNDSSLTGCCSSTVGQFSKGGEDGTRNAAIVKLADGMKWLAEILQIGFITGIHTITAAETSSGTYQVRKRGAQSKLTGGIVTAVGGMHGTLPSGVNANAMLIRPNPNPSRPGEDIYFSHFGDRGAVVVNEDNEVIGLLYDEIEIPSPGPGRMFHGVATPIQIVLDQLNALDSVQVNVATATQVNDVQTASNSARVAVQAEETRTSPRYAPQPSPVIFTPQREPIGVGAFGGIKEDLSRSGTGRLIASIWRRHQDEISNLINNNRRVATVWHRSGGPALLQALIRAFQTPSATVPGKINGEPLSVCIDRSNTVFNKYGSENLRQDLSLLKQFLPDISGLSYKEIMRVFGENHGVPELAEKA